MHPRWVVEAAVVMDPLERLSNPSLLVATIRLLVINEVEEEGY
jgi:hypothetical protein